jgi:excisionase family DNA binding protein
MAMENQELIVKTNEKYLKVNEVVELWNISRSLVYRMIDEGELRAVRINSALRIRQSDLESYVLTHFTS